MFKILATKKKLKKKCVKLWENTTAPYKNANGGVWYVFRFIPNFWLDVATFQTQSCNFVSPSIISFKKKTDDAINETNLRESSYLLVECLQSNNSKNSRMPAEICASLLFYRVCFIATKPFFIQAVENSFSTGLFHRPQDFFIDVFQSTWITVLKQGQCSLVGSISRAVETPLVAPDVSVLSAVLSQSCCHMIMINPTLLNIAIVRSGQWEEKPAQSAFLPLSRRCRQTCTHIRDEELPFTTFSFN